MELVDPITPAQVLRLARYCWPDYGAILTNISHGVLFENLPDDAKLSSYWHPEEFLDDCALFEEVFAQDAQTWKKYEKNMRKVLVHDNPSCSKKWDQRPGLGAWIRATAPQRLRAAVLTTEQLDKENKND